MQAGSTESLERTPRKVRLAMLGIVMLAAFAIPVSSLAGRGGGSNDAAWIGLNGVTDSSGARLDGEGRPNLGDYVTFSTIVPKNVNNPRIEVLCYQDGQLTFGMAGAIDYAFQLGGGGSPWKDGGGPAECVANLYYFSWKANTPTAPQLATTSFSAGG